MENFKEIALAEYNSDTKTVRRAGTNGKPFWNINSSQFMFVPQFQFPNIPGAKSYIYTATDSNGNTHKFEDNSPIAALTPIWGDIAVGYVTLEVAAVHKRGGEPILAGTRTFYKSAPFPGRNNLPVRARSYKESALMALRYIFKDPSTNCWLTDNAPDPEYYHNVFPSKMISSIIGAMVYLAKLEPNMKDEALQLAKNAADYLLSITYTEGSPLKGLPPTYTMKGLDRDAIFKISRANIHVYDSRKDTCMMIYPAMVGSAYIKLADATGNEKYLTATKEIAEYYAANVLPCGSWYLLVNEPTGTPTSENICVNFSILNFLNEYYNHTGDERFAVLEKNYYEYIEKTCLDQYNWEGQFEDTRLAGNYDNLTHFNANNMINYITEHFVDDQNKISEAETLMRFVEDQFVVWGEHASWNPFLNSGDYWYSPAALEQYAWYVPIDGSTGAVMKAFVNLYKATKNPLLLEKACALGDSITRLQNADSGVYPTHWMTRDCMTNLQNFWINCHIGTAFSMLTLAEAIGEI